MDTGTVLGNHMLLIFRAKSKQFLESLHLVLLQINGHKICTNK